MFGSFSTLAVAFWLLFVFKYVRLIGNLVGYWTYKPIHPGTLRPVRPAPVKEKELADGRGRSERQSAACRSNLDPSPDYHSEAPLTPQDVTVIIPALDPLQGSLERFLPTCVQNNPKEIFLVTIDEKLGQAMRLAQSISPRITVLSIERPNKRRQILRALPHVSTKIIVLADDDVVWPRNLLKWMLSPFDSDPKIGGVGTNQRVMRGPSSSFWDFLNSQYLIRRNFDCTACTQIDGGLPCLSGRTVAYRAKILQDPAFMWEFTHETWRTYLLNVDDDNFLTRWMVNHNWDTWIQNHPDCEVLTTLENNPLYISQCLRWSRTNWRSNLKSMFQERIIWKRYPWSCFAVFQTTLTSWSPLYDFALAALFWDMTSGMSLGWQCSLRATVYLWIFWVCRAVKYMEHWRQCREDLVYLPLLPVFGYLHTVLIKFWALCTINRTAWGSRPGADENDSERLIRLPGYQYPQDSPTKGPFEPPLPTEFHDDMPPLPRYQARNTIEEIHSKPCFHLRTRRPQPVSTDMRKDMIKGPTTTALAKEVALLEPSRQRPLRMCSVKNGSENGQSRHTLGTANVV